MEKEFVPYKESLALKELGFDEPCLFYFDKDKKLMYCPHWFNNSSLIENKINISAPTWKQAFKFFRDKHDLRGSIMDFIDDETGIEWDYEIALIGTDLDENGHYKPLIDYSTDDESRKFKTYEEAELGCLINLIQLVNKSKVL
jgi:hypothetical protein